MRHLLVILFVIFCFPSAFAQELFPMSEPASTMPKNTLGIRLFSETYKEVNKTRNMTYLRFMYGATPNLSVYLTAIASNHHGEKFPLEFPFHNTPERGAQYPYKLNGAHLYAKYRFLSLDGENSHFRMAAYGEGTLVKTTHHETEPDLEYGDNTGVGAGLIGTYLKGKFAVSATVGGMLPFKNTGDSPDPIQGLPDVPISIEYGKALTYSLSFGYLVLPKKYTSYNQTNVNLYVELQGKAYGTSKVNLFVGEENEYYLLPGRYPPALLGNYYVDISPGAQFIIRSNLRIDCSVSFNILGQTYARLYPVYNIGIQRYFYFNKKK